ncbi:MAG TPA: TIR domain-containing protein [Sphingomicrobium sp.]|nr:TIR domain-containing protein [Sphingomicrobium sp.]
MSHVFISYARSTEERAQQVAEALRANGYEVWRDDELPAHRAYSEVIEDRLKAAKAVVVLWSAEAVRSQWVRAEADTARSAGTLVQAGLDDTMPPIPFNQIQCAGLKDWDGAADHPGWKKLLASVRALVRGSGGEAPARKAKQQSCSVCVLPFVNMSGDAEQEYFSDGISEDITTDLSKISALAVTARNTAFTFKGQAVDVCEVARKLGVTHVLEGSVRKAGGRIRITAQLIDGGTGDHVWADRFDRDLTDIFEIQDEISKAIVDALKLKLMPEEKKALEQRGTTNADAYNLYLLARKFWVTGNHGDARREERVMRICGRAVQIDPYYAQAWALMAVAQSSLHYGFGSSVDDGVAAANTARAIDPDIAEAYCPMARRLEEQGRHAEALAEIEKGLRVDPDCWEANKEAGLLHMAGRNVTEATRHYEKAVEVMENDYHAWALLITCYKALNDDAGVRKAAGMMFSQAEKAVAEDPSNGAALGIGAGGLAALGQMERSREWIDRAMLLDPDNLKVRYNFVCVLAALLGDKDEAISLLGNTLAMAGPNLVKQMLIDPDLDTLRDDPRFEKMISEACKRHRIEMSCAAPAMPVQPAPVSPPAS